MGRMGPKHESSSWRVAAEVSFWMRVAVGGDGRVHRLHVYLAWLPALFNREEGRGRPRSDGKAAAMMAAARRVWRGSRVERSTSPLPSRTAGSARGRLKRRQARPHEDVSAFYPLAARLKATGVAATAAEPTACLAYQNARPRPHPARSALASAAALLPAAAATAADDTAGVASSRMSYSRFLEYLDMGRVKKVGQRMSSAAGFIVHDRGRATTHTPPPSTPQ
eukprot:364743-Chlamydomonas_euryale.AAC.9